MPLSSQLPAPSHVSALYWVDPTQVARRFPEKIFDVHVKNLKGAPQDRQLPGDTDNYGTVKALKEIGYTDYVTMEAYGTGLAPDQDEKDRSNFKYMNQLLDA